MPVIPAFLSETWYLFFLCLFIAMTAWMVFLWAVRSGQFKDTEETAERMIELDDRSEALPEPEADDGEPGTLGGHAVARSAAEDER